MSSHAVEKDAAAFHLPGHPLPILVELLCLDAPPIDMFMLSMSRPALVSTFAFATHNDGTVDMRNVATQPAGQQLLSMKAHFAALRGLRNDLAVYGLSVHSPECNERVRDTLQLPFSLLSDASRAFSEKLEFPTTAEGQLRRCTMLIDEGQITRVDFPLHQPEHAGSRAEELLRRDAGYALEAM